MGKDLRDYLPFYFGCEVRTPDRKMGGDKIHYGRAGTFIGFTDHTRLHCRIGHRAEPEGQVNVFMLQPVLRNLSDMTDEENRFCNELVNGCPVNDNPNPMYWTPAQFVYLLKQGFDLFGLIESGLAIEKKELITK